jgi:hypothetical protein
MEVRHANVTVNEILYPTEASPVRGQGRIPAPILITILDRIKCALSGGHEYLYCVEGDGHIILVCANCFKETEGFER